MTGEQHGKRWSQPARTTRGRTPNRGSSDIEFINRELAKEEIAEYRQWRSDPEVVDNAFSELLEEGYRVSVKFDDYSRAFAAFVFPYDDSHNLGFALSGRGGSPYRAIAECLFKHFRIFAGEWHSDPPRRPNEDDPDF